jgi:hypothetical protein
MAFLGFSIRAPLAILAVVVYVLGAATGGTLYALLRIDAGIPGDDVIGRNRLCLGRPSQGTRLAWSP